MESGGSLPCSLEPASSEALCKKLVSYNEELLAPCTIPDLEYQPLSAVCD